MINSAQIRAARGLLKWTQAALAHKASLSVVTLNMVESDTVDPRASTLRAIETALAEGGVEFIGDETGGLGVRFREPPPTVEAEKRRPLRGRAGRGLRRSTDAPAG